MTTTFPSTEFKELAVLFETWETRSNWFYPWARFSDFSRHIQLAKKKAVTVRVVFKPGHFHGVYSYHISKASDRWLRGGRRGTNATTICWHTSPSGFLFSVTWGLSRPCPPTSSLTNVTDYPEFLLLPSYWSWRSRTQSDTAWVIHSTANPSKVTARVPLVWSQTANGTGMWGPDSAEGGSVTGGIDLKRQMCTSTRFPFLQNGSHRIHGSWRIHGSGCTDWSRT